ncbi:MAG: hypothetical protein IPJ79_09685 [Bacteroidetes bacterium]|nr:hypothetical protein [Bacteroidota bacterium]
MLGFVLEKATGKTLSDYCSEKIWTPLNAVHIALWSLDILGQYVIAVPDMNMIIVRLGKKRSTGEDGIPNDYPVIIRESIKMFS